MMRSACAILALAFLAQAAQASETVAKTAGVEVPEAVDVEVEMAPTEMEFSVEVDRSEGKPFGVKVQMLKDELLVVGVHRGGLLDAYNNIINSTNPDHKVRKCDKIVEVNGIRGDGKKIQHEVSKDQMLSCKIARTLAGCTENKAKYYGAPLFQPMSDAQLVSKLGQLRRNEVLHAAKRMDSRFNYTGRDPFKKLTPGQKKTMWLGTGLPPPFRPEEWGLTQARADQNNLRTQTKVQQKYQANYSKFIMDLKPQIEAIANQSREASQKVNNAHVETKAANKAMEAKMKKAHEERKQQKNERTEALIKDLKLQNVTTEKEIKKALKAIAMARNKQVKTKEGSEESEEEESAALAQNPLKVTITPAAALIGFFLGFAATCSVFRLVERKISSASTASPEPLLDV